MEKEAFSQVAIKGAHGLKGLHLYTRSTRPGESTQFSDLSVTINVATSAVTWLNYPAGIWDKEYGGPQLLGKQDQVPTRRASSGYTMGKGYEAPGRKTEQLLRRIEVQ